MSHAGERSAVHPMGSTAAWGRRDSNPHWGRFKRPASACWATPPGETIVDRVGHRHEDGPSPRGVLSAGHARNEGTVPFEDSELLVPRRGFRPGPRTEDHGV